MPFESDEEFYARIERLRQAAAYFAGFKDADEMEASFNLRCPCRIDFHSCSIDELIGLSRTEFV